MDDKKTKEIDGMPRAVCFSEFLPNTLQPKILKIPKDEDSN